MSYILIRIDPEQGITSTETWHRTHGWGPTGTPMDLVTALHVMYSHILQGSLTSYYRLEHVGD